MKISARQYAEGLYQSIRDADSEQRKAIVERFLSILARSRSQRLLPAILKYVESIEVSESGSQRVNMVFARHVPDHERDAVAREAARLFDGAVSVRVHIDPHVLGGSVLYSDAERIDASIGGRLRSLKEFLR